MIKVHSLKNGDLMFVGGDPKRPTQYIRSRILSEGATGDDPEELARDLEQLAIMVRDVARERQKDRT